MHISLYEGASAMQMTEIHPKVIAISVQLEEAFLRTHNLPYISCWDNCLPFIIQGRANFTIPLQGHHPHNISMILQHLYNTDPLTSISLLPCTVCPIKNAVAICFVLLMLCYQFLVGACYSFTHIFRVISLALGQWYYCPGASKVNLKDMGKF